MGLGPTAQRAYPLGDAAAELRLVRRTCFFGLDSPPHLLHLGQAGRVRDTERTPVTFITRIYCGHT